jgi:hypothetical protein
VHVTPEEFVDVIEGTRGEASLPHLAECAACREELAGMRAAMTAAVDSDVPEPSPRFWERFSARVAERLDAAPDSRWWVAWTRPRVLVPVSALGALVLVVAIAPNWRGGRTALGPRSATTTSTPALASATDATGDSADDSGDALLALVSDLSASMDLESASAAVLAEPSSAERAVTQMNRDELLALKLLLQTELARPGA